MATQRALQYGLTPSSSTIHPQSHTGGGANHARRQPARQEQRRCLAQGHLSTQLGGDGDRTSDLAVTSHPWGGGGGGGGAVRPSGDTPRSEAPQGVVPGHSVQNVPNIREQKKLFSETHSVVHVHVAGGHREAGTGSTGCTGL